MADITSIQLPSNLSTSAYGEESEKLKSYLFQLTEQLRYVLSNLDEDNMNSTYNAGVTGMATTLAKQVATLTEEEKANFEKLRQQILSTATKIAHDYESAITIANDALKTEVTEQFIAENTNLQASMEQLLSSQLSQTSREVNLSLHSLTNLAQQTADALESFSKLNETWFRFTLQGLEIGKDENGETVPYTLRIDNEALSFLHYGTVVAYLKYNRLYISSAEISDRLSIGGSAGEGYYDFVTTATGLGIKWRAN